jgi:hypothetical protein
LIDGQLPDQCLFVGSGSAGSILDPGMTANKGGTPAPVAVFLPDGTAREDAQICFGRPGLLSVTLKLRALTGAVTQVGQGRSR